MQVAGGFPDDVLEQLVGQMGRLVESFGGCDVRDDDQLSGTHERLEPDRVVLEGPTESHALVGLGEPVPSQRADPCAAERLHERPEVDVGREVRLQNRHARFLRSERTRAQDAERAGRHAVSEFRPFDEFALREAMEGSGELLRVDAEAPSEALERYLGCRLLGQELEDLTIVLSKVVDGFPRGRVRGRRNHGASSKCGGSA